MNAKWKFSRRILLSISIGSPPLFGEIDIRRWKAKLGGGEGNIELRGGEWIVQFYVMENGGVGATFNRLRLSATLDIRFVAATFKLLPCLPFFFNALSPSLELGHK